MILQLHSSKTVFKVDGYHDPDDIRPFVLDLKPSIWVAGTVYARIDDNDYDVVVPTTFKGVAYRAVNPGISNATTEPTWALTLDEITEDFEAGETAGLTWKTIPYKYLPQDEDVSSVTVTCTNGVTLVTSSNTTSQVRFTIDTIASDADARTVGTFKVQSRVTTSTGRRFDISAEFKLAEG